MGRGVIVVLANNALQPTGGGFAESPSWRPRLSAGVRRTPDAGEHMSDEEKEAQLQGIVHASRYEPSAQGKQFLGAAIECSDGKVWVIDYDE
jgi:hypothetical protein